MTILHKTPVKGLALNFLNGKWERARWWYCLKGKNGEVFALVDWGKGMGCGGLVGAKYDEVSGIELAGYIMELNKIKPYQYETQKSKRVF